MNCQAVRPALSVLVAGELALTEWAIIQTHLGGCSECREELERLQVGAVARARTRRRLATVATLAAAVVILAAAAGGGFYIYRGGLPDLPRLDALRLSPWGTTPTPSRTATPTAPAPEPPASVATEP
ncbi:MAG: zf-HC2 domain-containing protein, partial [Candidatus Rokuibacteriota bacterium]